MNVANDLLLESTNRSRGKLKIVYQLIQKKTQLHSLYQQEPLRALFPTHTSSGVMDTVLINTTGGIAGGDHHAISIHMGEKTEGLITTQAAEKIYRSLGLDSEINLSLFLDPESWLEWIPQETILFNNARLRRQSCIHTSSTSRLMAGEILILGRTAHNERIKAGLLHDHREIYRDGKLIWVDALHLEDEIEDVLNHPASFNKACAYAIFNYVSDDSDQYLSYARDLLNEIGVIAAAATCVSSKILVVRWLGYDAMQLRSVFGWFWRKFRAMIAGLPEQLPTLWDS